MTTPINPRFARRYPEAAALAEKLGIGVYYVKKTWRTKPGDQQLTGYQYRGDKLLTEAERETIPFEAMQRIQEAREARAAKTPYERAADMLASLKERGPSHDRLMITECRMPCLDSALHWAPCGRHEIAVRLADVGGNVEMWTARHESFDACMAAAETMIETLGEGPRA